MGQRRDNGTGKQFGSHVDYVVEGALPANTMSVARKSSPVAVVKVRPSKYMKTVPIVPGGGTDGFDDLDADAVLFPMIAGWDAGVCAKEKRPGMGIMKSKLPVYDSAEEYLQEVPGHIRKAVAWYVTWLDAGKKMRDLPTGYRRMLAPVRKEYQILGRICELAETMRTEQIRDRALDRLLEFSEDDRLPVRQCAVNAAGKILEHMDKRDELMGIGNNNAGVGGGFTLSVNIAAMIGGGETKVVSEVVDAGQQQAG